MERIIKMEGPEITSRMDIGGGLSVESSFPEYEIEIMEMDYVPDLGSLDDHNHGGEIMEEENKVIRWKIRPGDQIIFRAITRSGAPTLKRRVIKADPMKGLVYVKAHGWDEFAVRDHEIKEHIAFIPIEGSGEGSSSLRRLKINRI